MMIFANLVVEREPFSWADLPAGLIQWVQGAGSLAAVALVFWMILYVVRTLTGTAEKRGDKLPNWITTGFIIALIVSAVAYLAAGGVRLWGALEDEAPPDPTGGSLLESGLLTLGGAGALLAVILPFSLDVIRLRWRRIWALAKLSFKEAIRRRVLWTFSAFLLVFLFASWFIDYKPENQVRNYVRVVYWAMTPLLLVTAGLLAAFSIPGDIRNQTIHTIVTKPVERFEIVVGRFLGYAMLMTIVLFVMTTISLLYTFRQIDPDARVESMRARVPVYGELDIQPKGENVGREWEYRRYIAGGPSSNYRAIWTFQDLPSGLASRDQAVPCEFAFDVFRTTKGVENLGVLCSFTFQTWRWDPSQISKYTQERERRKSQPNADPAAIDNELAQQYGYYELRSKEIFDYHTLSLEVPAGLFKNALVDDSKRVATGKKGERPPALQVIVKCDSPTQYVGVAKRDLYLLEADRTFTMNFFKGATGLWLRVCLVLGLAVAMSTYLTGVISFLTTMFLYIAGGFQEYVQSLAQGTLIGGGPMESFIRLANKENQVTPMDQSVATRLVLGGDEMFRWVFRRVLDVFPDVDRFDWTDYVAEGFNFAGPSVLLHVLLLAGYLLPWGILAYYLMKWREIAS